MLRDKYWQAIINRDRICDRVIIYGVVTTKIYCVPSCPSRKPKRNNVLFFNTYVEAEKSGFRACKRCLPKRDLPVQPKIKLVERICREIENSFESITLTYLSQKFDLSSTYLQRIFKSIVGISPKQYQAAIRLSRFKQYLREKNISQAVYRAGYNSSSSLYENISRKLGMTPKIYQQGGMETKIIYSVVECNLGCLLVATTEKGICTVTLGDTAIALTKALKAEFNNATIVENNQNHQDWINQILDSIKGKTADIDLPLDIRGTAFQQQVWQTLQKIPYGETRTYQEIANEVERPKATRAVGSACGANPVALVVPCHRVLRNDGNLGGYRWGIERKQKLLAIEQGQLSLGI